MTVERERVAPDLGSVVGEIRTQLRTLSLESAPVTFQAATQLVEGLRLARCL